MNKISILFGSIVGALILHIVTIACNGGTTSVTDAGAHAPGDCSSWTVGSYLYETQAPDGLLRNLPFDEPVATTNLPPGWEPIYNDVLLIDNNTITLGATIRRCAD